MKLEISPPLLFPRLGVKMTHISKVGFTRFLGLMG